MARGGGRVPTRPCVSLTAPRIDGRLGRSMQAGSPSGPKGKNKACIMNSTLRSFYHLFSRQERGSWNRKTIYGEPDHQTICNEPDPPAVP